MRAYETQGALSFQFPLFTAFAGERQFMSIKNKEKWIVMFILLCMVLLCLVYAAPAIMVLYTSTCNYTALSRPTLTGLENSRQIFGHASSGYPSSIP